MRLAGWIDALPALISRPVRKLIAEVTFGILDSGSLQQSEIARALAEPRRLYHTPKRLSRMLRLHSEVAWAAQQQQLAEMGPRVDGHMILALDPGDLNRYGAPASEYRGRVRDDDRGEVVGGYPLMSVVARDVRTGQPLPLLTRLLSNRRPGHRSENHEILETMETVQRHLHTRPLWVIDRGGDPGRLWSAWLRAERAVLVRAANQPFWQWCGRALTAQQIARELPMRQRGQLRHGSAKSVRFAVTQVHLREHPEQALTLIVVRHG